MPKNECPKDTTPAGAQESLPLDGAANLPAVIPAETVPPVPNVEPDTIPLRWVRVSHHTVDHIAARYPYAAYGSNLSFEQMVRRCPTSNIRGHGVLRNAKLQFAYHLGIVESEGATALVGVFYMTPADVAAMDRCEALGRNYERYLVTVEIGGEAVRCFTYVKRDNDLEEPSEFYYQTCLKGYVDWDFDTRRLRHARDHARKNGKRRTYSPAHGYWDSKSGEQSFDWDKWRSGTGYTTTTGNSRVPGSRHGATIPGVRSYDPAIDGMEPEGNAHDAPTPVIDSIRNGRDLSAGRKATRAHIDAFKKRHGSARYTAGPLDIDPARVATLNSNGQKEFLNPKNNERWCKGANGVWYRVSE